MPLQPPAARNSARACYKLDYASTGPIRLFGLGAYNVMMNSASRTEYVRCLYRISFEIPVRSHGLSSTEVSMLMMIALVRNSTNKAGEPCRISFFVRLTIHRGKISKPTPPPFLHSLRARPAGQRGQMLHRQRLHARYSALVCIGNSSRRFGAAPSSWKREFALDTFATSASVL